MRLRPVFCHKPGRRAKTTLSLKMSKKMEGVTGQLL